MDKTTQLYRYYDEHDNLLYIGISTNYLIRLQSHKRLSEWFLKARKILIEQFRTRDEAKVAERLAIQKENPPWNVVHTERKVITNGRPVAHNKNEVALWRANNNASISETAKQFNISESTVKRYCSEISAVRYS